MIFAELSYSPLKLFEKVTIGKANFLYNPIRTYNFAASNEMESQAIS